MKWIVIKKVLACVRILKQQQKNIKEGKKNKRKKKRKKAPLTLSPNSSRKSLL